MKIRRGEGLTVREDAVEEEKKKTKKRQKERRKGRSGGDEAARSSIIPLQFAAAVKRNH